MAGFELNHRNLRHAELLFRTGTVAGELFRVRGGAPVERRHGQLVQLVEDGTALARMSSSASSGLAAIA